MSSFSAVHGRGFVKDRVDPYDACGSITAISLILARPRGRHTSLVHGHHGRIRGSHDDNSRGTEVGQHAGSGDDSARQDSGYAAKRRVWYGEAKDTDNDSHVVQFHGEAETRDGGGSAPASASEPATPRDVSSAGEEVAKPRPYHKALTLSLSNQRLPLMKCILDPHSVLEAEENKIREKERRVKEAEVAHLLYLEESLHRMKKPTRYVLTGFRVSSLGLRCEEACHVLFEPSTGLIYAVFH